MEACDRHKRITTLMLLYFFFKFYNVKKLLQFNMTVVNTHPTEINLMM